MGNELTKYYEDYKDSHGPGAYKLEAAKDTSRVLSLCEWIRGYLPGGSRILDIGCGDMYLSQLLPEYEWTGVDVAPNMSNGRATKHDLMQRPYPFEAEQFDAAVCSEVLEHVWDLRIVHSEAQRLVKPKGYYFISTPNHDQIDYTLKNYRQLLFEATLSHQFEHIRNYNFAIHRKFLEEAKFKVLEYRGADAHFSEFFKSARQALAKANSISVWEADKLLGQMFPLISHTIMLASQK